MLKCGPWMCFLVASDQVHTSTDMHELRFEKSRSRHSPSRAAYSERESFSDTRTPSGRLHDESMSAFEGPEAHEAHGEELLRQPSLQRFISVLSSEAEAPLLGSFQSVRSNKSNKGRQVSFRMSPLSSTSPSTSEQRPDFSGRWVLKDVDGDFEAFLADIGTGWMLRQMAKSMNYGVGRLVQDITIEDEGQLIIATEGVPKPSTMILQIDGDEEESLGLDGETTLVTARWEAQTLVVRSRRPDGKELPATKRYMEDDFMILENNTSTGKCVKRYFEKQPC